MNPVRGVLLLVVLPGAVLSAQKPVLPLPPKGGLSMVQTLTMPYGDRESVHTIQEAGASGLRWTWNLVEVLSSGDTTRQSFRYSEFDADMRESGRLWAYHDSNTNGEHPGYTMHSISRAVFRKLRAAGSDSFQVMALESRDLGPLGALGGFARSASPVRWRGTIVMATPTPVKFPVLINGQRVSVDALHLRGQLSFRDRKWTPEIWVLADSAYPMVLRWVGAAKETSNVLQTIRIDFPTESTVIEGLLAKECRAELPGVYFAFNSAVLDSTSNRALASVAALLAKNKDWSITLEGHTDSIGSAAANKTLSEKRVGAVRDRLVAGYKVEPARLRTAGMGSVKPREPNTTIEGRARNRRVELVRECGKP